ncbi:MAG: glycosyl hydrolase [Phycisphaerae bacterium]
MGVTCSVVVLSGVNRCYLHDWAHQALNKKYKPGILMGWWGTHFGENQTWFKPGIAFFTYINRCQTMLQQGSQVCDICTLNCSPQALSEDALSLSQFEHATVHNGKITLPDGRAYAVMQLPNSSRMLPKVAQKLRELVAAGATVIGPRPTQSPSLTDYPKCDRTVAAIGRAVWGDCDGVHVKEHRFGKGMIVWNKPMSEVLTELGIQPDFSVVTANNGRIVIQSAIYAAPGAGREVDVTALLRKKMRQSDGKSLSLRVDNTAFGGDPAPGHVKYLTVHYTLGGKPATAHVRENSTLSIPFFTLVAIHRHTRGMDIYFVVNRSNQRVHAEASFRVSGKIPELWRPDSGRRVTDGEFTNIGGRTNVPLTLGPLASIFAVFRHSSTPVDPVTAIRCDNQPTDRATIHMDRQGHIQLLTALAGKYQLQFASGRTQAVNIPALPASIPLTGPWNVAFAPHWGAPHNVVFQKLTSWTASGNPGIKYFSGTAMYTRRVSIPADFIGSGKRVILHLGSLHDIAQVWVNGVDTGVLWHAPFKVDVTAAIRSGINRIRIAVTNTWVNRLIGDQQHPSGLHWGSMRTVGPMHVGRPLVRFPKWVVDGTSSPFTDHYTFETWNYYTKHSPLHRSGLFGPVSLSVSAEVPVSASQK